MCAFLVGFLDLNSPFYKTTGQARGMRRTSDGKLAGLEPGQSPRQQGSAGGETSVCSQACPPTSSLRCDREAGRYSYYALTLSCRFLVICNPSTSSRSRGRTGSSRASCVRRALGPFGLLRERPFTCPNLQATYQSPDGRLCSLR